ncbi:MAG: class I SAM-dependent methyltransferase [Patescibacteria group bacterium]|nr:class I SAM-dependent methyltransferase [Patescibacteria group bacterium]
MIPIQCALCGKKQKIKELYKENFNPNTITPKIFSARRSPDRLHYRIVKCINCGLIFSNPILPARTIKKLYKESDFTYNLESKFLKKTYGEYLKKILPLKNIDKLKILDIGCGNGFFLEEVMEMGIKNINGVEPSIDSIKKASPSIKKIIKNSVFKSYLFRNNSFDIICFFHTLDHIVNPNVFLNIVYNLLKKNGKVVCVVHDTQGLSVKLFGEKSPIFDIEHIYLFNKNNLVKIFKKNNLKPLKVESLKNRYPILYWIKLLPFPKALKHNLGKLLHVAGIGDVPITLNAGNTVIIAEKKN